MTIKNNKTCFFNNLENKSDCQINSCKYWHKLKDYNNCILIASRKKHTLQEIGEIFGVTRMRICQLEKNILEKLRNQMKN